MLIQLLNQCIYIYLKLSLLFTILSFFVQISYNRQKIFQSVSVVVKIWHQINGRVLKPKLNECHPFVNNQQRSMDIQASTCIIGTIRYSYLDDGAMFTFSFPFALAYCNHQIFNKKVTYLVIKNICIIFFYLKFRMTLRICGFKKKKL